jgi:hypothetical protein
VSANKTHPITVRLPLDVIDQMRRVRQERNLKSDAAAVCYAFEHLTKADGIQKSGRSESRGKRGSKRGASMKSSSKPARARVPKSKSAKVARRVPDAAFDDLEVKRTRGKAERNDKGYCKCHRMIQCPTYGLP